VSDNEPAWYSPDPLRAAPRTPRPPESTAARKDRIETEIATDVVEKFFVRVDVTEEFAFLATKM
jgi:hypothetical protein